MPRPFVRQRPLEAGETPRLARARIAPKVKALGSVPRFFCVPELMKWTQNQGSVLSVAPSVRLGRRN